MDIIERLRRLEANSFSNHPLGMLDEAADEIEQNRIDLEEYRLDIERLKNGYQGSCYACEPVGELNQRLTAENERLRAALVRVMIGGNSLALIIGADHPPYGTSYDEALAHYGGGVKYEAWCCWNAIMEARTALSGDKQ